MRLTALGAIWVAYKEIGVYFFSDGCVDNPRVRGLVPEFGESRGSLSLSLAVTVQEK